MVFAAIEIQEWLAFVVAIGVVVDRILTYLRERDAKREIKAIKSAVMEEPKAPGLPPVTVLDKTKAAAVERKTIKEDLREDTREQNRKLEMFATKKEVDGLVTKLMEKTDEAAEFRGKEHERLANIDLMEANEKSNGGSLRERIDAVPEKTADLVHEQAKDRERE